MNCLSCKGGNLQKELKTYVANLDACVIIVKNVPSLVCQQCGDVYYTNDVMKQLEKIIAPMVNHRWSCFYFPPNIPQRSILCVLAYHQKEEQLAPKKQGQPSLSKILPSRMGVAVLVAALISMLIVTAVLFVAMMWRISLRRRPNPCGTVKIVKGCNSPLQSEPTNFPVKSGVGLLLFPAITDYTNTGRAPIDFTIF